jgi:hypothetical protein
VLKCSDDLMTSIGAFTLELPKRVGIICYQEEGIRSLKFVGPTDCVRSYMIELVSFLRLQFILNLPRTGHLLETVLHCS